MDETQRRVDEIRKTRSEVENHLIDELGGRQDQPPRVRPPRHRRRHLPVRCSRFLAAACGGDDEAGGDRPATTEAPPTRPRRRAAGRRDAANRADHAGDRARPAPVGDEGGLAVLGQSGEYLTWSDRDLDAPAAARGELGAERRTGRVWTFAIRQGVSLPRRHAADGGRRRRHDGPRRPREQVERALGARAASSPPGTRSSLDDATVEFTLDAPNGNFPYLVSSDNYNLDHPPEDVLRRRLGVDLHGHRPVEARDVHARGRASRTSGTRATGTRQPQPARRPERDQVLRGRAGRASSPSRAARSTSLEPVLRRRRAGAARRPEHHRHRDQRRPAPPVHMRDDRSRSRTSASARRWRSLLDRQALVDGLFDGRRPTSATTARSRRSSRSTDPSVPQREQDVEQAKQLLADAGKSDGFEVTLATLAGLRDPRPRRARSRTRRRRSGSPIELQLTDDGAYYGDFTYERLALARLAARDHRLRPPRRAERLPDRRARKRGARGTRPHFKNPTYDTLVADYVAALRPRRAARGRQADPGAPARRDAAIIFPYFYNHLAGSEGERRPASSRPAWATST